MTRQELLQQILQHPNIVAKLLGRRTPEGDEIAWCIFHADGDGKPPHKPNLRIGAKGYCCFACKAKGSLRDLARHLGIEPNGATREPAATWDFHLPDGSSKLFQKCRFEAPDGKSYLLRRWAPENWRACPHRRECQKQRRDCYEGWIWTLKEKPCSPACPLVLYNQPMLALVPDVPVFAPEGEKCCDVLAGLDLVAVCNPYGASEWKPEYSEALRGRDISILVDADQPGRNHGQLVARSLWGKAISIKVIDLYPDRDDGSDVADWIAERRKCGLGDDAIRAELEALVAGTPEWRPGNGAAGPLTSPPTIGDMVGGEVGGATLPEFNFLNLRQRAQEEGFELQFLSFLGNEEIHVICLGYSTLIAAYPKSGKTTLLFELARQWADEGHRILYFTEEPKMVWKARVLGAPEEGLERMTGVPALGAEPGLLLQRASAGDEDIVIVDTTNLLGIQDGNDAATVREALTPWVEMARVGTKTLIFAHHTNKSLVGDLKAVAGSYNFAAIVDCVLLLCPDESPDRRVLGGNSRILPPDTVMYELQDGQLRCLGDPKGVTLEAVAAKCIEVLSISPGERKKTREVLEAMTDPKPSLQQVQQALNLLARPGRGEVLRDPPMEQGQKPGATYLWCVPGAPTSPPTISPIVGGEVGGPDQTALPIAPATGRQ